MKRNLMVALLTLSLLLPISGALAGDRDERKFERFEDKKFDRPFGFRNFEDDDRFFFRDFRNFRVDDDRFFFRNFEDFEDFDD